MIIIKKIILTLFILLISFLFIVLGQRVWYIKNNTIKTPKVTHSKTTIESNSSIIEAITELDSSSTIEAITELDDSSYDYDIKLNNNSNNHIDELNNSCAAMSNDGSTIEQQDDYSNTVEQEVIIYEIEIPIVETESSSVQNEVPNTGIKEEETKVPIDSYSYQLLAEICYHEAGSSWISLYDKAHVVAAVMNRVNDKRFPNTVYDVLTQAGQFSGYYPNCCYPTQECYDAVDYYFSNCNNFGSENSWYGDGYNNYFYYQ